jgi:hypothetical protein
MSDKKYVFTIETDDVDDVHIMSQYIDMHISLYQVSELIRSKVKHVYCENPDIQEAFEIFRDEFYEIAGHLIED